MDESEIPSISGSSQQPSHSRDASYTEENESTETSFRSERKMRPVKKAKRKAGRELFNTLGLGPKKVQKDANCWEIVNGVLSSRKRNSCSPNCIIHREEYKELSEAAVDEKLRILLKPIFEEYRNASGEPSSSSMARDPEYPSADDVRRMFQNLSLHSEDPAYSEIIRKLQAYNESEFPFS